MIPCPFSPMFAIVLFLIPQFVLIGLEASNNFWKTFKSYSFCWKVCPPYAGKLNGLSDGPGLGWDGLRGQERPCWWLRLQWKHARASTECLLFALTSANQIKGPHTTQGRFYYMHVMHSKDKGKGNKIPGKVECHPMSPNVIKKISEAPQILSKTEK